MLGACRTYFRACDGVAVGAVQGASPKPYRAYGEGSQRRNAPKATPSRRVADKKRVCFVARLADMPDIGFAARLASIAFCPQRMRESKTDRLLGACTNFYLFAGPGLDLIAQRDPETRS